MGDFQQNCMELYATMPFARDISSSCKLQSAITSGWKYGWNNVSLYKAFVGFYTTIMYQSVNFVT